MTETEYIVKTNVPAESLQGVLNELAKIEFDIEHIFLSKRYERLDCFVVVAKKKWLRD